MRTNDNFNIITGQIKQPYSHGSNNQRFASLDVLRRMKEKKVQDRQEPLATNNHRRLGTAKDSKLYQYSYIPKGYQTNKQQPSKQAQEKTYQFAKKQSQPVSLINATKTNFNIISHAHDSSLKANWQATRKKCPVSKFTDLGRINAPNYSETYKEDIKFGRKPALCNTICDMQHSYGTEKYFRKFK